jgi:hypothetical protein
VQDSNPAYIELARAVTGGPGHICGSDGTNQNVCGGASQIQWVLRLSRVLRASLEEEAEAMNLKRLIILVTPLTVVGVMSPIHSQTTPKRLRSFLVTSIMSSPQQDSPFLKTWTSAQAVREDGSWVTIFFSSNPSRNERDIKDFRSGVYTIVDDTTKSAVRESIPPDEYKHRLAPAVSCEGTPAGQILGLSVNYKEETSQITGNEQGDATALIKSWVVPDLGCFVLQKETIWTRNSDGVLLVDTKITPIAISFQPVNEFFEIPASYTERTRAEMLNLLNE